MVACVCLYKSDESIVVVFQLRMDVGGGGLSGLPESAGGGGSCRFLAEALGGGLCLSAQID